MVLVQRSALIVSMALLGDFAAAESPKVDFSRDIRPILAQNCGSCHGADEKSREGGLRLDVRESALSKKAIVPRDLKASKLVARIDSNDPDRQMPPPESKKKLTDRQKQLLKLWIEQGAEYSRHWAFEAPRRPPVPGLAHHPIDAFVLERILKEKMRPSPEADRATLLRRVTFDLTGLPPTLSELEAFLADRSPDAYDKVVDRLLASPRYAERMAMAWLDAARFADTNGYNKDEDRTQWPWRDWVIGAFARNLPYDRFIVEQLAGDLLPKATLEQRIATAFLRNQVHNTEEGIVQEEYRIEYVADRVHTTATVFLGLSMQCARCHDHKFDPITQREYYQFFSFFQNVSDKPGSQIKFMGAEPLIGVPTMEQRTRLAELDRRIAELRIPIREREAAGPEIVARWEKGLSAEDICKITGNRFLFRVALDEKTGENVPSSDPGVTGAIRGADKWTAGKFGNALDFDGETFVDLGNAASFDGSHPFSISLWVYPTVADVGTLVAKMEDEESFRGYDLLIEEGRLAANLIHQNPDNGLSVVAKDPMSLNAWHHVAMTYDGSRKAAGVKLFVDGKLVPVDVPKDDLTGTIHTDRPLHLGRRRTTLPFKGKLDEVHFFSVELASENVANLAAGKPVALASTAFSVPLDKRSPAQHAEIKRFYLHRVDPEYSKIKAELVENERQRSELSYSFTTLMVMDELPQPRAAFVLKRGEYDKPGEKVTSGVPAIFPALTAKATAANRLDLANWLVSPDHPLTARVAINRWWEVFFGTGLVKTVEDFGLTGEEPSHPELLDWLATEFMRTGWDLRAMQKLIVTSATYKQSSRVTKDAQENDPENRLLARGPRHRLPAETIRDNALAISGLLVERLGGPSVKPYQPAGLWEDVTVLRSGKYVPEKGDGLYRRGMYTFWKRTCPPPGLSTFDAPNREVCLARRATTNTPLQALVLLNDPTFVEAARNLAQRMLHAGGPSFEGRLNAGLIRALGRPAGAQELPIFGKIHGKALARFRSDPEAAKKLLSVGESPRDSQLDEVDFAAWTIVASTILNLDESITKR